MAENWAKFKEKLGSKHFSPRESDWETMKDMIEKQPRLTRGSAQWIRTKPVLIACLAFMMGGLSVYFVRSGGQGGPTTPVMERSSPDFEKSIPRGNDSHSSGAHKPVNEISGGVASFTFSQKSAPDRVSAMGTDPGNATSTRPALSSLPVREAGKSKRSNPVDPENIYRDPGPQRGGISNHNDLEPAALSLKNEGNAKILLAGKNPLKDRLQSGGIQKRERAILPGKNFFGITSVGITGSFGLATRSAGYSIGTGVDLTLNHRNFLVSTGIYMNNHSFFYHDSTLKTLVTSQYLEHVDSTWIIDGPFQGHYIYDTTEVAVYDTTNQYQRNAERSEMSVRYYELPVYLGYRHSVNRWNFEATAGLILNWRGIANAEGETNETAVGLHGAFRPSVTYFLDENWGITTRLGYRFNIHQADEYRMTHRTPNQWFLQAGISYNW